MAVTKPNNGPLVAAKTKAEEVGAISSFTPPSYKTGNSSRFTFKIKETLSDKNKKLMLILNKLKRNESLTEDEEESLRHIGDILTKYRASIIELPSSNNSKLFKNADKATVQSTGSLLGQIYVELANKTQRGGRRKTRRSKKRSKKTRRRH